MDNSSGRYPQDKNTDKRVQAVLALGLIPKDRRSVELAEQFLNDPRPEVRRAAVSALGDMESSESLPKIKALLEDADPKTVVAIAAVLKKFNDPAGYKIYYEIVSGQRKGGPSIFDGIKDKKNLEMMGLEEALGFIPFASYGMGAYCYFQQSNTATANVNASAATALAQDPDPTCEQALIETSLHGKPLVQVAALRALAKRGNPAVAKDIESAMYSRKSVVSYTAAATVVHLSDLQRENTLLGDETAMRRVLELPILEAWR